MADTAGPFILIFYVWAGIKQGGPGAVEFGSFETCKNAIEQSETMWGYRFEGICVPKNLKGENDARD